jgi:endonuclease/exonuclease/phosphatase family metal-dependent hydrolase
MGPGSVTRIARWAALGVSLCVGCATAKNYLEPTAPRYSFSVSAEAAREPAAAPETIRVVTFNIEYAKRVEAAIRALSTHPDLRGADVIALQEMDAPGVERIAQALSLYAIYYPAALHHSTRRDIGNAILSPWPIEADRKLLLPHRSRIIHQGRASVTARVLLPGRAIRVYSVHLGSPIGISGGKRRQQAEVVLADTRGVEEPIVVAGDFNSSSVGRLFEAAGFAWPTKTVGGTRGRFSFDHIFVRGLAPRAEAAAGVARDVRDASDHRPVWTVLELASRALP